MKNLFFMAVLAVCSFAHSANGPKIKEAVPSKDASSAPLAPWAVVTDTLSPSHDAYLEGVNENRNNGTLIKLEEGNRIGYMMFDLSAISGTITNVELQMTVATDGGSGTLEVFKGDQNNWTETNLSSANKPVAGSSLGSISGTHNVGDLKSFVLNATEFSSGIISFVITHTGGSDVWMASEERTTVSERPKLIVTYTTSTGDVADPSVPSNFSVSNVTDTSADFSWDASTDDVGIAGYKIYDDGNLFHTTVGTGTLYTANNLTEQTLYKFTISAYDAAGKESAPSDPSQDITTQATSTGGGGGVWNLSGSDINYTTGNVGIGTTTVPSTYKLAVNGKIISEEIKVQLQANWPDYVFAKDYQLPTLEEVEAHIHEKGRLINLPPAQEVEANGLEVGEMNRLLLEKIEELTLYILEQNERIEVLEQKD